MTWTKGQPQRTGTAAHRRWRTAVLTRDQHTCQRCGHHDPTGRTLEADHIHNVAAGGDNTIDNGQALCKPCHDTKTRREQQAGRAKNGRRRPTERHPGLL